MNHVHLPAAVGIAPFVLVKVCQSPMCSQHFASSVRPTSDARTYCALPACWRAPVRPFHVRRSYVLRTAHRLTRAVHPTARLPAPCACWRVPTVPRRSVQRRVPVRLRLRAARPADPFCVRHDRTRPTRTRAASCPSSGQKASARPSWTIVLFSAFRARGGC